MTASLTGVGTAVVIGVAILCWSASGAGLRGLVPAATWDAFGTFVVFHLYVPFAFTYAHLGSIRQAKRALQEAERDGRLLPAMRARPATRRPMATARVSAVTSAGDDDACALNLGGSEAPMAVPASSRVLLRSGTRHCLRGIDHLTAVSRKSVPFRVARLPRWTRQMAAICASKPSIGLPAPSRLATRPAYALAATRSKRQDLLRGGTEHLIGRCGELVSTATQGQSDDAVADLGDGDGRGEHVDGGLAAKPREDPGCRRHARQLGHHVGVEDDHSANAAGPARWWRGPGPPSRHRRSHRTGRPERQTALPVVALTDGVGEDGPHLRLHGPTAASGPKTEPLPHAVVQVPDAHRSLRTSQSAGSASTSGAPRIAT